MKEKKEIVIVNQFSTRIFLDIVNAFVLVGYRVTIFTGTLDKGLQIEKDVKVVKSIGYNRSNNFFRLATWILFSTHFFFYSLALKSKNFLVVSNPPLLFLLIYWAAKIKSHSYTLLVYDLYPDVIINMGFLKSTNLTVRLWRYFNKKIFSRANLIITISEGIKALIDVTPKTEVKVIYNWANNSVLAPKPKHENWFAKTHQLVDKRIIMYSGNFGLTHGIESLVEVAHRLINRVELKFVFIGEGTKKKKIEKVILDYKLENVLSLPFQKFEDLPYSLASADIGVVALDERAENVSVPSKTYYLMASGCALLCIASSNSELSRIVSKFNVGKVFLSNDIDGIADFLVNLTDEELNIYKKNSQKAAAHFTPENARLYVNYIENYCVSKNY